MSEMVAELLAAIPDDEREESAVDPERLRAIFDALAGRNMPTGSLRRLCSLGGLKAQIALAYGAYWLRGWFQSAPEREKALAETHLKAALRIFAPRFGSLGGGWAARAGHRPEVTRARSCARRRR